MLKHLFYNTLIKCYELWFIRMAFVCSMVSIFYVLATVKQFEIVNSLTVNFCSINSEPFSFDQFPNLHKLCFESNGIYIWILQTLIYSKGQLISKGLFKVFTSTKKRTKIFLYFCNSQRGQIKTVVYIRVKIKSSNL